MTIFAAEAGALLLLLMLLGLVGRTAGKALLTLAYSRLQSATRACDLGQEK